MNIKIYDKVLLKDGRTATIVELISDHEFLADVGNRLHDWDAIDITLDLIDTSYAST